MHILYVAMATTIEASQSLIQSESRVHSYQEVTETRQVKKKTKSRRHKDEGSISVSKSSEKLYKKMKADNENPNCAKCSRPVYAMERVKAEKRTWHKECFRCVQCNKQLTVETYQSDHTTLYCKPHFKQLFEPKPVDDDDEVDAAPKKHQMIICESQPVELPPDVVRASDKPDLGLEELASLDVKSRFEVFERKAKGEDEPVTLEPRVPREKSTALLSKLAKFKAKGMDIGVSDEYLNGVPIEHSSSEQEEEEDEDSVLKSSYMHNSTREQTSLCDMNELVGRFENARSNADRHSQRKLEIQNIRSRLFLGKQAKIKEMYEQSVMQCEQGVTSADKIAKELELDAEKSRAIKQRFENGEIFNDENQPPKNRELDDPTLFNEGIAKKSRSIFLELDANAKHMAPLSPPAQDPPKRKELPFVPKDVVRAADKLEDVKIETADISDRFKFFETYKPETKRKEFRMTPPRQPQRAKSPSPELYHEPSVAREGAGEAGDAGLAASRHTASRMINVFRQMEESRRDEPQGPKPLKRFTPPPADEIRHYSSSEYSDTESEEYEERESLLERDEALKQAQQLARTKSFRDRFENWSEGEKGNDRHSALIETREFRDTKEEDGESQLETAKSLREKFENMKVQTTTVTKTFAAKVNRFV